jgi:hypothetical protein
MFYPLSSFLQEEEGRLKFNFFASPRQGMRVRSVETRKLLSSVFHFIPGRTLEFSVKEGPKEQYVKWEVQNDMYNNTYLFCPQTNSKAYFVNDGTLHYFTLFEGKRNSLLYFFYMGAYKVLLGYYQDLKIEEQYPLHLLAPPFLRYLHDFTAPFFQYMRAVYSIEYLNIDDDLSPSEVQLRSKAEFFLFKTSRRKIHFSVTIKEAKFAAFEVEFGNRKILAQCIK